MWYLLIVVTMAGHIYQYTHATALYGDQLYHSKEECEQDLRLVPNPKPQVKLIVKECRESGHFLNEHMGD